METPPLSQTESTAPVQPALTSQQRRSADDLVWGDMGVEKRATWRGEQIVIRLKRDLHEVRARLTTALNNLGVMDIEFVPPVAVETKPTSAPAVLPANADTAVMDTVNTPHVEMDVVNPA